MPTEALSAEQRRQLLYIARQALCAAVCQLPLPAFDWLNLPAVFREDGAVFVTLTRRGELRGCIGALEAYQPLAEDVREHAAAAALQDYRFHPVQEEELDGIRIEISRLTAPELLAYDGPDDLLRKLRLGTDGVVLRDGFKRATFLPQVWEKLPDAQEFLAHLCNKMGGESNLWRRKNLEVLTYQVEEFHEEG